MAKKTVNSYQLPQNEQLVVEVFNINNPKDITTKNMSYSQYMVLRDNTDHFRNGWRFRAFQKQFKK